MTVSLYFGWTITVRYFPVCDCRHLHCYTCLMTIELSSPHGLQRTCICTVYKQTYRQLQADMDSLCQFLFRENALCRSRSFTFCIKQQERERKWAKKILEKHAPKTLLFPSAFRMFIIQPQVWKTCTPAGAGLDSYWLWVTYDACGRLSTMEY